MHAVQSSQRRARAGDHRARPKRAAAAARAGIRLAGATSDVHIMDVRSGKWERMAPQGEPPSPRAAHAAAAVGSMVVVQARAPLAARPRPPRKPHALTCGRPCCAQGGIGPAGLASEDLHVLDFTDFERPRWHRRARPSRAASPAARRGGAPERGARAG